MSLKSLCFIVILYPICLLQSQTVTSTFNDFTIADCVSTPCKDIIVEGGVDGLSFKYIDCNCNTTGVYIPKGKAYVLKALVGTIDVAQGAFIPTGVISEPVTNTQYESALQNIINEAILLELGSIDNFIDINEQNICAGDQPTQIMGREGQFFDFDVSYSWLKSFDNTNYEYIRGATQKDYTPGPLEQTTYFKRQIFTAVSTGTFSAVHKISVANCENECDRFKQKLNVEINEFDIGCINGNGLVEFIISGNNDALTEFPPVELHLFSDDHSNFNKIIFVDSFGTVSQTIVRSGTYNYSIEANLNEGICNVVTGTFNIEDNDLLSLISTSNNRSQAICDSTPIDTIIYQLGDGASNFTFTWIGSNTLYGSGITAAASGTNQYIISGTPTTNVTQTTFYTYQISTTRNDCGNEVVRQGSIRIDPLDNVSLLSEPGTDNQSICLFDYDNPQNSIAESFMPIEYQLEGGAIGQPVAITYSANDGPVQNGLPPGLGYTITSSNTVLITGSVSASSTFTTPTVTYSYQITTGGSCSTSTIRGDLTVYSPPILNLTSAQGTASQTLVDQSEPIEDIVYTFEGGANSVSFTWVGSNTLYGSGITAVASGTNQYIIAGTPTTNVTQSTVYTYQLETIGSACGPEVVLTGTIEVTERPDIPTQVRPNILSSIFLSPLIKDNVGEIFIGPFNTTNSPTLKEGQKYYNIKHQKDEEN